ncbi:histidinol dehydrogenase [Buchnera aphidicola]|jgi:histidinol dehydrogenase|uniref:Histidinol dehydrogenase n=1 Tax=Buchnera aphidicola subsp. Schizaphis graminum (strain Sg) TaxID=198804 RepID=HISX_BUCAP|nr:histidinol dehydrogenase [Buchnera aphidicola]Q9ZHE6.1 RecName: Full=Histidinol dehydrogenase; Short=HDH [Buchnera aphidicola str. Sg (Schizaphis graminum)]AAC97355.1 histidinol dehydrogenase [Buchnera aphidicola]AAM67663.1 histidinol dehydrogenase [Buchnera aphidicola str. Sg (Schizaphis graminum)]AWI49840.1 histidinol dehydrogenase [Buchnera aphidicola (Schizaphis graminum)]
MKYFNTIVNWNMLNSNEQKNILLRPVIKNNNSIKKKVKKIIENIQVLGEKALREYTILFEKCHINKFEVSKEKMLSSSLYVNQSLKDAISTAKKNITSFHTAQILSPIDIETQVGVRCQQIYLPLNSVGIYIPSGIAPLFSTVLMLAIPAKIAGCKQIILCSPPPIDNTILYAANICGVDKIFQMGGAQAIAALAFGTKNIPKVDKIFGPGNAYVTEAKLQVSSIFNGPQIDMLAGPSELLIIADEASNADFIAADLLSQAEHSISSQVILLTPSLQLAKKVIISINNQLKNLSKSDDISTALDNSVIILTKDLFECIKISNIYAPEHLIIQTKEPRLILKEILNASSIFLGPWSPESAGDYASGTNHVLPTYGKSVSSSALGLCDFKKRVLIQELTSQGFINLSNTLKILSEAEKLEAHKNAVKIRVDFLKEKI